MKIIITIDENLKCKRCGEGGAITESGYCLECIDKNLKEGKYAKIIKKKLFTRKNHNEEYQSKIK